MKSSLLLASAVLLSTSASPAQTVAISAIANATGYQATLAPDTVFVIFGSGMGPGSIVTAGAPYPESLGGTSVTFTPAAGGAAIPAKMVYSLAGQIAGLLPSSITPGTYAVRVTYNNQTSAAQNVTVAARSFGIATADSSGSGNAQATIGNINGGISLTRFSSGSIAFGGNTWTLSAAHPGDTLVLWGTGGGADPANDSGGTSGDQTAAGNFVVIVGGRQITPLYAGASSGYPGLWQVNFTLPADITTGCFVYAQVSAAGELSNGVNIPIAPSGQNTCVDPDLNPGFLAKLDAGGTVTAASFAVAKISDSASATTIETASGFVGRYKTSAWLLPNIGPKFEYCTVFDRTFPVGGVDPASPDAELNAGPSLSLTGGNTGAGLMLPVRATSLGSFYGGSLPAGSVAGGTYTLTAPGGTQVGPFTASMNFPSSFTVTNLNSITMVDRTKPLTFSWTGSGFDRVYLQATSNTRTGSSQHIVTINCVVPANLGTYSIPIAALGYLQPTSTGALAVEGMSPSGLFTANLTPSGQLDLGIFVGDSGFTKTVPVQ